MKINTTSRNQNDVQDDPFVGLDNEDGDEDGDGDNNHGIPGDFSSSGSGLHSEGNNNPNTGDDDYQTDDDEPDDISGTPNTAPRLP